MLAGITTTAVDNFYNRGNITTTGIFSTSAKDIFLLNEEIASFTGDIRWRNHYYRRNLWFNNRWWYNRKLRKHRSHQ